LQVEHVVLVSIDGLRPEFYLGEWEAPTLKAMAREGAHAKAVEGVFPSMTYPSHASIVTGVGPGRHGIVANQLWDGNGPRRERYWWAKDIKSRTLWQAAREKGLKVAVTYWPTTVGAEVDWLVAEVWDPDGRDSVRRMHQASTPGLLLELALTIGVPGEKEIDDKAVIDRFITAASVTILGKYRPNLQLIHLVNVDGAQHQFGRDAPEVRRAVREQDANIAKIRQAVADAGLKEKTLLVVTGDHGFMDVSELLNPNALLRQAGFLEMEDGALKSWRAMVRPSGGSAAVYVKDAKDVPAVTEVLRRGSERDGRKLYALVDRARLDELGCDREAALALDAEDGFMFSSSAVGDLVAGRPRLRGMHGHLPTREKLFTGFVAEGPGIRPGSSVDRMRLVDVAPTIARLLGLEMKDVEGAPVAALLR
jgi:predicted AlkP superfamily pyrophosphatase or phosphodiesterase